MSKGSEIRNYCEERLSVLGREADAFPWADRGFYAGWAAQTYYYVCHSTRLLALAASRFGVNQDSLHLRFLKHAGEEKRHEVLALNDLKAVGEDIAQHPELPETKSFYQVQYYWIEHVDPVAFYGYIVALEGLAVGRAGQWHARVSECFGPKAASFLKVHAADDPDHMDKAYEHISSLDSGPLRIVRENLDQSCRNYLLMLEAVGHGAARRTSTSTARRAA